MFIIKPRLSEGERKRLQKAVGERVYSLTTNSESHSELFRSLYSSIKAHFQVESYNKLAKDDLQKAIRFVENWSPGRM